MFRIGKTFKFEAAHYLRGLSQGHKCARAHGHSYTVEVMLTSDSLTPPGFVVDFAELGELRRFLDEEYDHRTLNDVLDVEPTAENLALKIYEWCAKALDVPASCRIESVRVHETATSWAEYVAP